MPKRRSANDAVVLRCKCFSKTAVELQTVFTKSFRSTEEFTSFLSATDADNNLVVHRKDLTMVLNVLQRYNVAQRKLVPNKSLVVSQTNIFSTLDKSFVKCGEPVKWYVITATRLVVGDVKEMPYPYTSIRTHMQQYLTSHKDLSTTSGQGWSATMADGPGNRATDDVFVVYSKTFGGDKVHRFIDLASEALTAACVTAKRIGDIYSDFNGDRGMVKCNSVTYANLRFYESLSERFGSVLDILLSTKDTWEQDMEHVLKYREQIKTVSDEGRENIVRYISDTIEFEKYNPSVHRGYDFESEEEAKLRRTTPCGVTEPPQYSGDMTQSVLKKNLFVDSLCKQIKGMSVTALSSLCNSNRTTLMSGESVLDILRGKHGVKTNTAFMGVPQARGYHYCRMVAKDKLTTQYASKRALDLVKRHLANPSMTTYNDYCRAFGKEVPRMHLNEIINNFMTVFAVSLDVDSPGLVNQFYSRTTDNAWPARENLVYALEDAMAEFMSILDCPRASNGKPMDKRFVCHVFESKPSSPDVDKVGLRVIYRFKRMVIKNTEVLCRFITAFKFFLSRKVPAVAFALDISMYCTSGRMLRLPMNYKLDRNQSVKQLLPLFVRMSSQFTPACGLIHAPTAYLANNGVKVLSDIGDITTLIRTAETEEFNIRRKQTKAQKVMIAKGDRRGRRQSCSDEAEETNVPFDNNLTEYFTNILHTEIIPAIHSMGGGYADEKLLEVRRKVGIQIDEYSITPLIHWCVSRPHRNPQGNPCRYFIKVYPDGHWSLCSFCFACNTTRDILVGCAASSPGRVETHPEHPADPTMKVDELCADPAREVNKDDDRMAVDSASENGEVDDSEDEEDYNDLSLFQPDMVRTYQGVGDDRRRMAGGDDDENYYMTGEFNFDYGDGD
ncbi:hypothetical protein RRG08_010259 [Elysia crispata]|uniref:Uncharacterized protein n=1 Tax=Elysia crispata TaxID=231223 RepID=A0AAE1D9B8_9GAST|nr:hypothetical protein RRG08_010259 [Elysia crispata]